LDDKLQNGHWTDPSMWTIFMWLKSSSSLSPSYG
jgi:hypothetical protein